MGQTLTELIDILLKEENILSFLRSGFRILLILLSARIAYSLINKGFRARIKRAQEGAETSHEADKSLTLIPIFENIVKIGIWSIVGILVLGEFGINTSALIAGIGMLGIALGLAAQSMIRDLIAGFLLILENMILVGDSIVVGNIKGTVEQVGIRYTKIRLFSGELRIVPNSELSNFGNKNRGFMRVIVEVGLAYEQDLEKALLVMQEAASIWAKDNSEIIIEAPSVQAITEFGDSALLARIIAKVKPGKQGDAERTIRTLLKQKFDERNVDMPFPTRKLYLHTQKSQDFNINVENLDILSEPGSKEEIENHSPKGMVLESEVKKMSGAMNKLKKMFKSDDRSDNMKNKKD